MLKSVAQTSIVLTVVVVALTVAVVLGLGGGAGEAVGWALLLTLATRVVPILASFPIAYWLLGNAPRPGAAALAGIVGREVWATIRLFFFYHPFEKLLTRHEPSQVTPGEEPVILVHGFYANAGFWHRTKPALIAAGWHNLYSLNLEPPFNSIDDYARQLRRRIEEACAKCGTDSVVVIAHSMGGLVARAAARDAPRRIRHLICLGTPHHGTVLASLVPSITTRQMRPGNAWLRDLNPDPCGYTAITNVYSEHDNIIVPQTSAALAGAENIPVRAIGHLEMAFSSVLKCKLEEVLRQISRTLST